MHRNALRTFVSIVEAGSMHAASDALHLSQSAVSRQILVLEEEMGTALFERRSRGVSLTSAGEIFLRYARDALAENDRIRADISALKGLRRGTVRVAAAEAFMTMVLPDCIAQFRHRYPGVFVGVEMGTTFAVVASVRDARADFGIAYDPDLSDDMETAFSVRQRMSAVMTPRNPLARRRSLSLSDLAEVPLALPPVGSATGALIYRAAREIGLALRPALESNSVQMRVGLATRADLVAILAPISAIDLIRDGKLVAVPLRDRILSGGSITLFSARARQLSTAAETLMRAVHRELQSVKFRAQLGADSSPS